MYLQIADDLRRQIESEILAPGGQLPTEMELQDKYGASRNTVRDAIKRLTELRLVETRPGKGTFVKRAIVPFVTTLSTEPRTGLDGGGEEGATYPAIVGEQGREAEATTPLVTVLKCPPQIAVLLKMRESESVVRRYQERYIDGTTWSLQTSYYPITWVQMGAEDLLDPEDIREGVVKYLASTIGLDQVGYRDLVRARLADDNEQFLFELTHSHTVIEVCTTSFAEDGNPIRVTVTVFPSDRNQIVYDVGVVPYRQKEPVQPREHDN
jgi:GntR family transcriptional regulator